ncbi:FCGBP protein, partial [Atlantisia rogersi]|nr:FCGBP protein [Atlantisia rogersi]
IKTDFGLTVTFDWYSYARVILPVTYSQAVCGLCGNANNDPQDDFASPDGQQAPNEIQFADSWKVADVPGCWAGCDVTTATGDADAGGCNVCTEQEKRVYRGDKHCGLLVKKQGPFAACHGVLDPAPFFADCLFDTCLYKGHQETVCRSIAAYVTACQAQGVHLKKWRTAAFCSLPCPPNQHYELCGSSCPPTCRGQWEAEECEDAATPCSEGCFCDEGFLRSGDRCVPLAQCGCYYQGRYYKLGEEFFACPRCSERCTCQGNGKVECQPDGCAENEVCEVQDGVRGCYSKDCGLCQVLGAVSYTTFDGRSLLFAGTCSYTLAVAKADGTKEGTAVVPFTVEMEKEGLLIRRLLVTVHGVTIDIARGTKWEVVGGEQHLLPLTLAEGAVTVSQEGTYRVLRVQDGPRLLYDGDSYVLLTLPDSYRGRTAGLCGNFDGNADDDTSTPQELGEAWGTLTPTCTHGTPPTPCPTDNPGPCGVLVEAEGPFAGCHKVVSPQEHLAACVQDQCGGDGGGARGAKALCHSLQAYAAACQAAGGQLQEWRAAAKCPLSCPPNSRYELCTHTCRHTCASLTADDQCTPKCFEGCQCDEGFLFNGQECVHIDSCGC